MALTLKGLSGENVEVANKSTTSAALGLGIAGTALGVLNSGGLLSGLFGNGAVNPVTRETTNGTACLVSKDLFYNTIIQQNNTQHANALATERRLSSIEAAVSQNAAVSECNKNAIRREIEVTNNSFDRVISNERIVNDLILRNALCEATKNVVRGETYLSPCKLADNYIAPSRILDSYIPRDYLPGKGHYGGQCGASYGGYDNHCGPCGF